MIVLVDYDNVPRGLRSRGLDAILDRLLASIGSDRLSPYQRIRVKLYGGWYEGKNLTRVAQDLSASTRTYPKRFTMSSAAAAQAPPTSVIVTAELAQSLEIDRKTVLENTYRAGGEVEGMRCEAPPYLHCINRSACPLSNLHTFINTGTCPEAGCSLTSTTVLKKAGQKLVDTMMTADLIHLAANGIGEICVASSDDDLWPGIKSALILGSPVVHVRTKVNATAARYARSAGAGYTELMLR